MRQVATKLLVPPLRPGHVPRARLTALLDEALTRPLTLVTAPAGFGKTTVVSTWLRGISARSAWVTLDEDDDVPGRVLECLLIALREVDERLGKSARSLQRSSGQSASVLAILTELINELAGEREDLVVVLDEFQSVTQPEILDATAFLVEHCPPRLHVVLLSRQEPALPLSRWRANGVAAEIGTAQLRFAADEAAALLASVSGSTVTEESAAALLRRTEGWAAGLQLFGIALREGSAVPSSASSVRHGAGDRYVLDYLADEVLREQPPELRAFLRRTSVLDALTPGLCDAVTGCTDSAEVLRGLERANLFLSPIDGAGRWYRYHGLFADYLRSELTEEEAAEAHSHAAAWYAEHGAPTDTIKHALAAGDNALAVRTVRSVAEDQVRRGELASLLSWLNRLPESEVRSNPDLAGFKGWLLYLGGRVDEAESYAAHAQATIPPDAPATAVAMLRTFQAYLALTQGRSARAAELAGTALDLLGESTSFFRAAAMGVLGQARRLTGDRGGAIEVLRAAVRLGERSGNALSTLEATGYLAPLLYVQGRLREAVLLCEEALAGPALSGSGRRRPMAGLVEVPLGTLLYERDDLTAARRLLVDGIDRCEQLGTTSYSLLGLRTLARLHIAKNAPDDGFRALLAARRQADAAEDHRRARLVVATTAELHLRNGNIAAAEQTLAEITDDRPSTSDYEQLTVARLLLAKREPRRAVEVLDEIEDRAVGEGRDGSLIAIRTVSARAREALGDTGQARDLLAQAVASAAPDAYRRTFLDEGAELGPLLRAVADAAPEFVADLLTRFGPAPRKRASARRRVSELRTVVGVGVVETLTETQRRILGLIATGMSNQQVADKLFITVGTTKWHLNQIFGRLQAGNRTEAVARARELGLF